MIAGDTTDWDGFFKADLVPDVLDCVQEAWGQLASPAKDDGEVTISLKLYVQLVGVKNRNKLPFRFGLEVLEVDLDSVAVVGRKDIVVFPRGTDREEIYLALEAKRLNAQRPSGFATLAPEYVSEGMLRYVEGKYAAAVQHGVMLGYVMDGNVPNAVASVDAIVKSRWKDLCMSSASGFSVSSARPANASIKESCHTRKIDTLEFRIHHAFLAVAKPRRPKTKRKRSNRK